MPHQCVHCKRIIPAGSQELLDGCEACHGRFFFYIRDEMIKRLEAQKESMPLVELQPEQKERMESEVREILKIEDEEEPVILDLESVKVLEPGKFEIDIANLLSKKPVVFKLEEGKYIIDLESTLPRDFKKK
jgi:hypothetical protein